MTKLFLFIILLLVCIDGNAQNLLQIYELGLQNDLQLKEAEANRDAVLETKPQSIARLLPTLSANSEVYRSSIYNKFKEFQLELVTGGRNVDFWSSTASFNLRQPIYHGDSWVQLSQADNQIAEAEANYIAAQQSLMMRTAESYFNILLAQDTLAFNEAEQRAIENELEQAKARYQAGIITIIDVNEAQASYDKAKANTIQATKDLEDSKEILREIVGDYSGNLSGLVETLTLSIPQPDNIEEWSKQALENNPTIIAGENNVEVAKKLIDLKFAEHLPTVDLVGSAGFTNTDRPFGISTEYQYIGMQANVPLFAGGSINSKVRQARHLFEAAKNQLDAKRRTVRRQVKDYFNGIHSSISEVQALKTALESSQSSLKSVETGFDVGIRTMADILTSQRFLYRTKRDYAKARYEFLIHSLKLKQSAGALRLEDLMLINHWLSIDAYSGATHETEFYAR
jgi:outer membrane protein